uniref:Uncharacterized protein n=1 Tax=Brassica oleracea var. oleracea TaxID=109376 RepID=A0A0D3BEQ7_BRAOL
MGSRSNIHPSSGFDGSSSDDDILLLPETMFRMNCVPETALSPISRTRDDDVKTEFYGVLDTLPQVTTRSHVMMPDNLGSLAELVKDETTTNASATVTYAVTSSSAVTATNSAANASSDMQQMVNPQSLQQQQLLERMRKRMGVDGNAFNPMNSRHEQQIHQQFRKQQQQIAALSNMQQQQQQPGYNQFRQLMTTTLQNQIAQQKQIMVDFVKRIVNVNLKAVASRGCPVLMPSLHAER